MPRKTWPLITLLALTLVCATAGAGTAQEQLAALSAQAGSPADPARGQRLFTSRHGGEWSCSSCHLAPPIQAGRHASTGKAIAALAPAANPQRFSDPAKSEKWFRRNCKDVLGRECSNAEKADVLAWLLSLKP